ncbi:uncharacterized protein LOC106011698 [Aplysia californica]|uniref:Uncharacterized protein LOC106011698 n=1 Tax=Aplysia californica TaxID=6500 RepID=A0ABM0ZZE1_APLCA|nr:uncharacterized protein LOC106011698 [Aplysia californica]
MPGEDQEASEEMIEDLLDSLMRKKHLETVSLEEYRALTQTNFMFMELMGQCLPPAGSIEDFKKSIDPKKYTPSVLRLRLRNRRQKVLHEPPPHGVQSPYPINLAQPSTKELEALRNHSTS